MTLLYPRTDWSYIMDTPCMYIVHKSKFYQYIFLGWLYIIRTWRFFNQSPILPLFLVFRFTTVCAIVACSISGHVWIVYS